MIALIAVENHYVILDNALVNEIFDANIFVALFDSKSLLLSET